MPSPWLKRLFISANIGVTLFCIQDQVIGLSKSSVFSFSDNNSHLARIKTDALEPDLPKGSIVLVQKSFDKIERGDVVLLR